MKNQAKLQPQAKNRGKTSETGSIESMVAALAHEIKNPLNSMKGAGQYLKDKYSDNPEITEFSSLIIDEIGRLERYLNEFISFSRGTKLLLRPINLYNYLTGVLMTFKHSMPCEISYTVKRRDIPDIMMDPEQFRQVLSNLFANAKEALSGMLTPSIELVLDSDDRHAIITVRDNGPGISRKDLQNIFMPFYSKKESGLGIGLAISRTIIKKHSGDIKVRSALNKGASFTILLPLNAKRGRK